MPHTPSTQSFQSLHSPRGANAHFALGLYGARGGFGLQASRVAQQDVFIGYRQGMDLHTLPFFGHAYSEELQSYLGEQSRESPYKVRTIPADEITRTMGWGTDSWETPRMTFTLYSPVSGVPDPDEAPLALLKSRIAPALPARLTFDNSDNAEPIQGYFAVNQFWGLRPLAEESNGEMCGFVSNQGFGFACRAADYPQVQAVSQWELPALFVKPNPVLFRLGSLAVLLIDIPAGESLTLDFVLGWYKAHEVTAGARELAYGYTRHFSGLNDVLAYGLEEMATWRAEAEAADAELAGSNLNFDQQFIVAQSTLAYYASSLLFAEGDRYRWAVNEGSYMMLNTFDLAVDHIFFELRQHPWVVANVLDSFADEYSYYDKLHFPGDPDTLHPGGVSFTHDQGASNTFSPAGYSAYEVTGQEGTYAYMTQEQLVNFILSAGLYGRHTGDIAWLARRADLLQDCLDSMLNRDHPDPTQRNGIMSLDSSRTGDASEITTYDSLDASLGQARYNLYLAVKCWAAYLSLEWAFTQLGLEGAAQSAHTAATRCAATLADAFDPRLGYIPAILDGRDESPIIPAIEGLVFPHLMGLHDQLRDDGLYGPLVSRLRTHLTTVLQPGLCLFPDGSWRLSAHSENSWISKIFLCQYVARQVLGIDFGDAQVRQDRLHADWWRIGCPSCPGIDQIFAGKNDAEGFHYPRAVTSILWLTE
jgi:hypothetical protein